MAYIEHYIMPINVLFEDDCNNLKPLWSYITHLTFKVYFQWKLNSLVK